MKYFRSTILIGSIILLTVACIFWRRSTNSISENTRDSVSSNASTTNPASDTDAVNVAESNNQKLARMGITPNMTKPQMEDKMRAWYISEASRLVPEQKPFQFYGKVIDETKQGVPGASIHLVLSTTISASGTMESNMISAADGSFALTDMSGSQVGVDISKEGYYVAKSLNQIYYNTTGNGSSQVNPVLFHLRKKRAAVDLITSQHGAYPTVDVSVPHDGTPVSVDFFNRKVGNDGQMEISGIKPERTEDRGPKEWSVRMSIPGGGFVEENDEFPFEAPESGYQATVEFDFKPGQADWTDTINKHYYIKFGNPPKYGRIDIQTGMYQGVRLGYAIDPNGSQDLEPQ